MINKLLNMVAQMLLMVLLSAMLVVTSDLVFKTSFSEGVTDKTRAVILVVFIAVGLALPHLRK